MKQIIYTSALALFLVACGTNATEKKSTTTNNAIPVRIAPIQTDSSFNTIQATGLITTENEARLSFKIGGVIEQVYVEEGQQVKQGQLLASLNTTEIAAQVQQVQLSVEKAQRDYQRAFNLYRDSVVTLEQFQNSKTGWDIAKQNLQQAAFNLRYAKIYASANGFVVKRVLNAGEVASPGSPVVVVSETGKQSKWVLRAGVADVEWSALKEGDKASVTVDAYPGKQFNAVVSKKSLAADAASGSFQIELQIDFGGLQPAVGLFGKAIITPSVITNGFSIPYEALLEANGKKGFVFVTNDQKKVERVEVTIASIETNRVFIADGLKGYSYVVVSGSPYLTGGAAINVIK